jgi:dihydroneopterin aldolase
VLGVTVTVHKPEAPIPVTAADIAVTLTRSK